MPFSGQSRWAPRYPQLGWGPLGARRGSLLFSSGVAGYDPRTGELVDGLEAQLDQTLRNVQALVDQAGGTLADVAHVTVLVHDFDAVPALDAAWGAAFGAPSEAPARHVMPLGCHRRRCVCRRTWWR